MDKVTGDGESGKRIEELRQKLSTAKLVSFFKTPDELANLVAVAVQQWEQERVDEQSKEKQSETLSPATEQTKYDLRGSKSYGFVPEGKDNVVIAGEKVSGNRIISDRSRNVYAGNRTIKMGSGNYNERIEGNYIQGNYYAAGEKQNLAEAAAEIQALLEQLSKTYPADTTTGKMRLATEVIDRIESNPTLMERILSALKAGSISALEQALNHPAASFVIGALEDWQQTKVGKEL